MTIGNRIKQARQKTGLSQSDLADKMFVTQQAVQKWENDKTVPQMDKLKEIAAALNTSPEMLLYDDTKVKPYIKHDVTEKWKSELADLKQKEKEQGELDFIDALSMDI